MLNVKNLSLLAIVGLALTFGTGCADNKTKQERESLLKQNNDLNAQLEAEKKARADAEARANMIPTNPTPGTDALPGTPGMGAMDTVPVAGGSTASTDHDGFKTSKNKFGQNVIEIPGDVLFASGKAALQPAAKKSLDKVAALIKKEYNGQQLRIEGHTDPAPVKTSGWDDNWDLGAARARAVLLYLASKGISEKHMYIASFAANDPKSSKNQAANRRVEIVVTNSGR